MNRRRPANRDQENLPGEQTDSRFTAVPEARKKAMDYLARREHGQKELAAKLESAGFEQQTAAEAIAGLVRDGLQDDARFVESFIASRANQGKGPVRIRLELGQRGIVFERAYASLTGAGHCSRRVDELERRVHCLPQTIQDELARSRKFAAAVPASMRPGRWWTTAFAP